jgi:hypothetical protein
MWALARRNGTADVAAALRCAQVGAVSFDREGVANHAAQLVANVKGNLRRSLESIGVVRALALRCAACSAPARQRSAADAPRTRCTFSSPNLWLCTFLISHFCNRPNRTS